MVFSAFLYIIVRMKYSLSISCFCLMLLSCSPDHAAYESCRLTLTRSVQALPTADGVRELDSINQSVTDTLAKYGHAKMSREMLDSIRTSLESYQQLWQKAYEKADRWDSLYMRRVIDMPGIGPVEFKAPPEV